ncbi:MAG: hypothetical protein US89_C0002G0126 [Candidatus Peregrinibacteria bacterium GW2011_GWF2_38_29]|nr:MAG: hypothetical protein US89_C0002G0126 [Candidatus Peregrinibacteria bacterium GW2011_GWF2_38_29]HBB02281.1 hypothetical protein [Candidatus Peregrinibacteria bacterium]
MIVLIFYSMYVIMYMYYIITKINMNMRTILSISEARKRIFEIADDVSKASVYYTLTENGRPKVVIMSAEEFESWTETIEVMREFPDILKEIEEVEKDMKSGKYKNYTTLDEILEKEGYKKTKSKKI